MVLYEFNRKHFQSRMILLIFMLMLIGFVTSCTNLNMISNQKSPEIIAPEFIPIVAYCGPPERFTTVDRYQEMVDCGFTYSLMAEPFFADYSSVDKALACAESSGVKVFLGCNPLKTEPEKVAQRYRNHAALGGYYVRDEPSAEVFPELKAIMDRIKTVDNQNPCYVNLLPNWAPVSMFGTTSYKEYVDRYVEELPISFLSFDNYPISGFQIRPNWYNNLELISRKGRETGLPFWAFALVSSHWGYYPATLAQLRLQMYSNLAYGAQGLLYFPYWAPNWDHTDTCIDPDGNRGEMYGRVKKLNEEIHKLSGVFIDSRVVKIGHTTGKTSVQKPTNTRPMGNAADTVPNGTSPYIPQSPVKWIQTTGRTGAIVSHLVKQDRHFLVIVNRDYANLLALDMEFDGTRNIGHVLKDSSVRAIPNETFYKQVEPGDVCILTWR